MALTARNHAWHLVLGFLGGLVLAACAVSSAEQDEPGLSRADDPAGSGSPSDGGTVDGSGEGSSGGAPSGPPPASDLDAGRPPAAPPDAGTAPDAAGPNTPGAASCTPADCDDRVTCTVDACGAAGQCTHTPDDGACKDGETCSASAGCQPPICAEAPCRIVSPQCGCGTGKGCYPLSSSDPTPSCQAAGKQPIGSPCTGVNGCVPGALCLRGLGSVSICRAACVADADCGDPDAICLDYGGGNMACGLACDPVQQTGCPAGSYCDFLQETSGQERVFTDCVDPTPTGGGGQLASCAVNECAPGFLCNDLGIGLRCYGLCETNDDCQSSDDCLTTDPAIRAGQTVYGLCR